MFFRLFAILPLAELIAFVIAIKIAGWGHVLLWCAASAALGALLLWRQGLRHLRGKGRRTPGEGVSVDEIFSGACMALAGILLIIPGFLTDILAGLLLLPRLRRLIWRSLTGLEYGDEHGNRPDSGIIEGEFERVADEKKPLDRTPPEPPARE